MSDETSVVKPIHVTLDNAIAIAGEGRTSLYDAVKAGELTAVKAGRRTLLIYDELVARCAARPTGLAKRHPSVIAGRNAYEQKRQKTRRRK